MSLEKISGKYDDFSGNNYSLLSIIFPEMYNIHRKKYFLKTFPEYNIQFPENILSLRNVFKYF